jgi:transcription initiation factor TFIIIB Brf1 subunit/transcription initiation factor TFIIB
MTETTNLDDIWAILDKENEKKPESQEILQKYCKNCSNKIIYDNTCRECGLITNNDVEYSSYVFEEQQECKKSPSNTPYSNKILKMQEWLMWTNNEKTQYKLNKYTRELCEKLEINETLINGIISLVSHVMLAIKTSCDGPKRSRVKDGIIIVCVYYISKNESIFSYSYINLCKKVKLDLKYASRADKLIMELINSNKLKISQEFINNFLKTETPISYVIKIIEKYDLNSIKKDVLKQVSDLIDICEDNDILLDHTPLSIGVSCFYYILLLNTINIDVKIFSEIYNLSIVTILKTYNKLKVYTANFEKMGLIKL